MPVKNHIESNDKWKRYSLQNRGHIVAVMILNSYFMIYDKLCECSMLEYS